jgi:hypothetical protein
MPTPNLMATTTGGDVHIGIIGACAIIIQPSFPTGACGVCFFVKKMSARLIQLGNKK